MKMDPFPKFTVTARLAEDVRRGGSGDVRPWSVDVEPIETGDGLGAVRVGSFALSPPEAEMMARAIEIVLRDVAARRNAGKVR